MMLQTDRTFLPLHLTLLDDLIQHFLKFREGDPLVTVKFQHFSKNIPQISIMNRPSQQSNILHIDGISAKVIEIVQI